MIVDDAYRLLEKIITSGFLTVGVNLKGTYIVLKNISDKELINIGYYSRPNTYSNFLYKLCFSTFCIDGENVLFNREVKLDDLKEFYNGIPSISIPYIAKVLKELNDKYLKSIDFLEGFCYTRRSRYIWNLWNVKENINGIAGSENLGLNYVQENWIAINKNIDKEESYEKDFNLSILVASSMNPKGAKSISVKYDARKEELQQLRDDIAKYGYDKKRIEDQEKDKNAWTAPIKGRDDLVRELHKQMRGEKDKHDLYIERWMERQKEKAEEAKEAVKLKQQVFREKLHEIDLTQMEASRPVTVEELERIQRERRSQPKNGSLIKDYNKAQNSDRFIKKISARIIR